MNKPQYDLQWRMIIEAWLSLPLAIQFMKLSDQFGPMV